MEQLKDLGMEKAVLKVQLTPVPPCARGAEEVEFVISPCMLLKACEINGGDISEALDYACAMEMIHTYSLIHDDLPGMDDDCLRRGKPTNHVVFGVGQAVLAGDGLLNYAFETMLKTAINGRISHDNALKAIYAIARGAGVTGMIAGQCADLYAEGREDADEQLLGYIHAGKTAAMFIGAVQAGAHLAGADETKIGALTRFAEDFGRLFQVRPSPARLPAPERSGSAPAAR